MAQCNNCRTKLGCSCKRRTASDGKGCCVKCISGYERTLKHNSKTTTTTNTTVSPPVILNATAVQKK